MSASGTRHAMGGEASFLGGLVLDMRAIDHVRLDAHTGTVRVGAGATWRSVLKTLHEHDRAVASMPSIDVLSVGGTVSVNAHGVDFRRGSDEIVPDPQARMMYAHLSTAPSSYLEEAILYTYSEPEPGERGEQPIPALEDARHSRPGRFALNSLLRGTHAQAMSKGLAPLNHKAAQRPTSCRSTSCRQSGSGTSSRRWPPCRGTTRTSCVPRSTWCTRTKCRCRTRVASGSRWCRTSASAG